MMPVLAKTDRTKLAKVLALLGSDREGEALAEARAAARLINVLKEIADRVLGREVLQ